MSDAKPSSVKATAQGYGGQQHRRYATPWGDLPSVNTVLQEIHKPGLVYWKEQMLLTAVGLHEDVQATLLDDVELAGKAGSSLKMARDRIDNAAADRGTAVHEAIETFVETGVMPKGDFAGYVTQARHAMETCNLEIMETEVEVASPPVEGEGGYAGTADVFTEGGIAEMLLTECSGSIHVLDWKSGNVYPESAAQLAGYSACTHHAGGKPFAEGTDICQRHGFIVKLGPRSWSLHVADLGLGRMLFDAALGAYYWRQRSSGTFLAVVSSAAPGNGFKSAERPVNRPVRARRVRT